MISKNVTLFQVKTKGQNKQPIKIIVFIQHPSRTSQPNQPVYSRPNLFRMIKFAKQFPDREIVSTLSRQLSWSHFVIICSIDDDLKRDFYAEMCRVQRWSVRALQKQVNGML